MRISELKMYGFKSFADKTSIKFEDDFVAIIGPNGSGKSNIIDAIRWVFGEQSSKSLRGASSTDVIFGGTQKRKKMNFAEVTLVLDNSDNYLPLEYREIAIKRRLYKSGESTYSLNGIECRLKDITELIMDSAMGKDSFSIISQGKIEEIITAKPEHRRQVIEEVAGVLKYKKRKDVALKKLIKTDENLEQVQLILTEMQDRLGPLEKQSQKAQKYLSVKSDLEKFEVTLTATKINHNKLDLDANTNIEMQMSDDLVKLNTTLTTSDTSLFELQDPIRSSKLSVNQIDNEIKIKTRKLAELESEYKLILDRAKHATGDLRLKQVIELKNNIERLKTTLSQEQGHYEAVNVKNQAITKKYEENNQLLATYRRERFSLNEKLNDSKELNNSVGFSFAVKQLKASYEFKHLKVIKELFTTSPKYSEAIVNALGGRTNEVVCDDLFQIKKAIKFLKDKKYGRATFIPLDQVRKYKIDEHVDQIVKKQTGFIDYAINLINFDEKYLTAFNNILATTIIVDTIDNANLIAKQIKNRYRIVTLTGDIIATGGTISGGHTKAVNQIALVNDISQIEEKLKKVNHSYQLLLDSKDEVDENYSNASVELKIAAQKVADTKNQIKNLEYQIESAKSDVEEKVDLSIEVEITELRTDLQALNEKLVIENQNSVTLENQKEDLQLTVRNTSSEINEITSKKAKVDIQIAKLKELINNDMQILSEDYNMSFEMALKNATQNINVEEYDAHVKDLKRAIRGLGIVNIDAIEEFLELSERYNFINDQKIDLDLAKAKLLGIIDKLDEIVKDRFEIVYEKLRSEFKVIFGELFAGGQADLVLTNPSDMLYTGVEIVAQPPGKKLQTISLLSGGEKALTAISLLFAILRIRTVPFAILDEVEAALDDANVHRYAKYLKVFSTQTQFLVITHRQGTMEIVDTLYGITMAEKGVSSVVSVKLNEQSGSVDV